MASQTPKGSEKERHRQRKTEIDRQIGNEMQTETEGVGQLKQREGESESVETEKRRE